jgi:hypothetical protein
MALTAADQKTMLKIVIGLFNGGISGPNLSLLGDYIETGKTFFDLSNTLTTGTLFATKVMGGKITVSSQVDVLMGHFGFVADTDPDSAGFAAQQFLTDVITQNLPFGDIIYGLVAYLSLPDVPAKFATQANLLNNKALVAELYVAKNKPDDYDTNVLLLADITGTKLLTTAEASALVDLFSANKVSLTTSTDNLTGTSEIDIFSGVVDPTGNSSTLSNADVIDGGSGADQLDIRIASTSTGGTTIAPVLSSLESYFLQNQSTSDSFTLNFSNISNEAQVSDKGSVSGATTRVINVDSTATLGMNATLGFFEANMSGDRSGSTDAFTLALNGSGTATQVTKFSTVTTSGTNDDSFEIANISSTSNLSNITLGTGSMTLGTVNVSGDANLMLGANSDFAGLSTIDASSMTAGGVNIDARGSSEASFSFTGSSANDRVILKNSTINTASLLNGGNGTDTLATQNFNNLTAAAVNNATGFSVLEGVAGAESFSAGDFTGINEFLFTGTTGSNNGFTVSNIESTTGSADRVKYATDISSGGNYALRLEGKNAGTTATIELNSTSETNGETVFTSNSNNNDLYGIEIRTNISTLTLDSTGTGTNANVIETSKSSNDNGYAFGNSTTPVFNITGTHDLVIMAKAGVNISNGNKLDGFSNAASIDASTFTGALRIAGSSSNDVIIGGSGADIIYGQNGADTLTGNNGADQFRLSNYNNSVDKITDFSKGTDKIGLSQFDFGNTTATSSGATLATTDYIENRLGITTIGSADANKVIELQASLSGSQIAADNGAAIEAFILVHNSTTGKAELWYDNDWSTSSNRDQVITFDNIVDLAGVQSFSSSDFVEFTY